MLEIDIKPKTKGKSKLIAVKVDAKKKVIPKGDSRKPHKWKVNVGKKFTGTSKHRRFFDTEAEANEFIRQTESATRERGKSAFDIPQPLAIEAMNLTRQLEKHGLSLTDAVKFFLRNAPLLGKKTVNELIPPYLEKKTEGSYRYAQKISLGVFAKDFGSKPVASIFPAALEKWFKAKNWEALNERNYMRDLSMFFRWAVKKDYCPSNPMDKIDRPPVVLELPEIFTVEETERVLRTALLNLDLNLLPMYAIGFFAGVRVEEIQRMRWEMIDWAENEIRLPARITKTGRPRNFAVLSTLRDALADNAPATGDIVSSINLRLRREKLLALAGVPNKRNGLRHSFATYYASKHRDPGALQEILGQQTPSVLYKHYITAVRQADAERYFKLVPPFDTLKAAVAEPLPA